MALASISAQAAMMVTTIWPIHLLHVQAEHRSMLSALFADDVNAQNVLGLVFADDDALADALLTY
jgi:hypothetical protein